MKFFTTILLLVLLLASSIGTLAQQDSQPGVMNPPPLPGAVTPQQSATAPATAGSTTTTGDAASHKPDRAQAYYHYSLAHIYEEMMAITGRTDFAGKAVDEYRLALENDPTSEYLNAGLAELYLKTGRIRDAVNEAQSIIQQNPGNLDARRLLGRIYLRSLGDMRSGAQSQNMLQLAIEQYQEIVKQDPNSLEDHLLLGRLYRLSNDMVNAEQEFRTAVKLQPNSEEAASTLSYLYNEEGDYNRALNILLSLPESSRSAKLYAALGYTYEQKKDYKSAIQAYTKSVDIDHDNLDAMRGLAQNLLNDNQPDAALEQYKQITEADPQDAQSYLRMAEIYRRDGKFDQALAVLKKAQAIAEDSFEVPYSIAVIYDNVGRYDEAAQILQDLLKRTEKPDGSYTTPEANNRSIFLERLGTVYRDQNKTQLALDTFRKMVALGDDSASRGYQQLVETYRDTKQWSQATDAAAEATKRLPNDRGLKLIYAGQLADTGQADVAISSVKAMLKGGDAPEDREIWTALAQMYSRLRRWKEAQESIAKAEQLSTKPEDKDYTYFIAGSIYERQKHYDQAEEAFHKVINGDPRNATALNYLGYMLADRGTRLDEALGYIRRAITLDPQNGAYLDSLGWAYFKMGNYELAEENLRKASERLNNDPTVHDHLADLYQKTGRLKQAVAHWERAVAEWNRTIPAEIDSADLAKVQKKLENAKMRLAQQKESKE
jgi:tetratricopeptide (TPR) repeat protein